MACATCGGSSTTSPTPCTCTPGSTPFTWPCTDALPGGLTRTRFYEGMALSRDDLASEQQYWIDKRRLTNRALGSGVVWGLRSTWSSKSGVFQVNPGYALDCCGRDLVLTDCHSVAARSLLDRRLPGVARILATATKGGLAKAQLVLTYSEVPEQPRPVKGDACCPPSSDRFEPSRMRESARLCIVEVPPDPAPSPVQEFLDRLPEHEEQDNNDKEEDAPPIDLRITFGDETQTVQPRRTDGGWAFDGLPLGQLIAQSSRSEAVEVAVELRAAPGWALVSGSIVEDRGESTTVLTEVRPPADLSLAACVRFPSEAKQSLRLQIEDVAAVRLFDPSQRRSFGTVEVDLLMVTGHLRANGETEADGTVLLDAVVRGGGRMGEEGFGVSVGSPCLAPLWTLTSDLRPLVLGALYTALQGSGTAWSGSRVVAWWAYQTAWRLLYGDSDTDTAELSGLLRDLLLRWCDGFVYPGPRCTTDHQGVVLGTMTLDRSAQVTSFSPWEGRRHVMTGPLAEHWLGQLGIAAPDVWVANVLQTVCCAAQPAAPSGLVELQHLTFALGQQPGTLTEAFGTGGIALSGGAHLLIGEEAAGELLEKRGWTWVRTDELSAWEFAGRLFEAFTRETEPGPYRTISLVRGADGLTLALLLPASEDELESFQESETELMEAILTAIEHAEATPGALGSAALQDLLFAIAKDLPWLDAGEGKTWLTELRQAGQPSLGQAVGRGAEGLWQHLRDISSTPPTAAEMTDLWKHATDELIRSVKQVWRAVEEWSEDHGAFSRDAFADGNFADRLSDAMETTDTSQLMDRIDVEAILRGLAEG